VTVPPPADANDDELTAARERVAALLEWATHVQLDVVVVSTPDRRRLAARSDAGAVAARHGRRPLLVEAVTAAQDLVRRAFATGGFTGTWAVTDWSISVANGADRVAASAALEEAAVAMVVLDVAEPETTDVLQSTWDNLVSLRGIARPGDLARLTEAVKRHVASD